MPYHILLVDDDHYFRTQFKEFMEDFDVIEAANGQEAVKILKKPHNIDLIILDERLPETKGTDLLGKIHTLSPNIRSVILTGHGSKEVAVDAVRGHATDYIEKPLTSKKIEKIRQLLLSAPKGEKDRNKAGIEGKIEQAKYFTERNYDKKLTLNDIANEVCLSPKYLSRIFKEKTGMSFVDYKINLRIEKAKELLKEGGDNIEEISYKLGYQNPESFGKIFKKIAHLTPRDYREQNKSKKNKALDKNVKTEKTKKVVIANKLLKDSKDAIIEYDISGKIISWSKSAEKMYGWKKEEMIKKSFDDTILENRFKKLLVAVKQGKGEEEYEAKRLTKSNKELTVWGQIVSERGKNGKIKQFMTIERNVTKRKRKTDKVIKEKNIEIDKTKERLEEKEHLAGLGKLASIVAHEMRRPINSIQMAAWNIKKKIKDPSITGNIACIEEMVAESEQIISNLLNYSRIKFPAYRKVVIFKLLDHCITSTQKRFGSKKATLRKDLNRLGKKGFSTDPVQFKQIISNLIMNAYEALSDNKISKITVKADTNEDCLIIKITDNGKGIDKDDLAKIYEPFFTKKAKGTGLGLSVCQEIIALHNGKIHIDSKINKGTAVTIQLPLKNNK
ncbi:MAG: ATP-binding protein [Patescibacteria group bacterium]|nr:ATP-binding protein [Patescibacteria group bacterium]